MIAPRRMLLQSSDAEGIGARLIDPLRGPTQPELAAWIRKFLISEGRGLGLATQTGECRHCRGLVAS